VTREQPHFDVQTHSHGRCWGAERGAHEEKVEKFRGDDSTSHDILRRWCFSLLGSKHDRWQVPAVLSNVMTGIRSRSSGRQRWSAPREEIRCITLRRARRSMRKGCLGLFEHAKREFCVVFRAHPRAYWLRPTNLVCEHRPRCKLCCAVNGDDGSTASFSDEVDRILWRSERYFRDGGEVPID
jgi:hypothetical protein